MKNVVEAFIEKNGSVGDWGGDQSGWLQALGAFTQGWNARIEAVEQSVHPTLPKAARVEPDPLGMDIADPTPDSP